MILNEELLKRTRQAGNELSEAERKAELARAEYHTQIRRLHLASGSLREVAQAVGLSHQRIQQIVDGAGGTWWTRIWRSRNVKRDTVCTYCERPPSEVASLVAGPDIFICDGCIALAENATAAKAPDAAFRLPGKEKAKLKCSFCGKAKPGERAMIASHTGHPICRDCLVICRQILTDRVPRPESR